MSEVPVAALRDAIRNLHGCDSTFVESVPVVERFKGQIVWEGTVVVFDLIGHPKARRAYAWSADVPGTERRRFVAVLRLPPVDTAADAVKASIVADRRSVDTPRIHELIQTIRERVRGLTPDWADTAVWVSRDLDRIEAALPKGAGAAWEIGNMFGVHAARNLDVGPAGSPHVRLAEAMYALSNALREAAGVR